MYINPREVAADAFMEIIYEGAYNNEAVKRYLKRNGAMDKRDKALVTEIVNGTLRNLIFIDHVINCFSNTKTEKMKPLILTCLRQGAYQILFMDRIPVSAACNEAVKLAEGRGFKSLKGFVNGVLRSISRQKDEIPMPDKEKEFSKYVSVKYSFPEWIVKMWIAMYGGERAESICAASLKAPRLSVTCNTLKTKPDELKQKLEGEGMEVLPSEYFEDALIIKKTDDLQASESFKNGYFHIQDESSLLAVKILDAKKGERVADVCSAPGGKSFSIAERMENKGYVLSGDVYEHKAALIKDGAERLGINIIDAVVRDAAQEDGKGTFDKVLVDAPCSGLGLVRKKPDIKLTKTGEDIDALIGIQRDILKASASLVKKGGTLVYSTCTICRKENTGNIKWFMENFDFESVDITEYIPEKMKCETAKDGYIELLPDEHSTDGFFIAKFIKKGE
ncbi:MAG: 16S rRNA (cytosine(967)-C(5))-methyltransferase RsmB [Firmicutes bacterium]|nr:16S rRNA (cytosine(967)-C(5))-methyltransferase RsmB [Bacillota bacterium]